MRDLRSDFAAGTNPVVSLPDGRRRDMVAHADSRILQFAERARTTTRGIGTVGLLLLLGVCYSLLLAVERKG